MEIALALSLLGALWWAVKALNRVTADRLWLRLGLSDSDQSKVVGVPIGLARLVRGRASIMQAAALAAALGFAGLKLTGPLGLVAGLVGGASFPVARARRMARRRAEQLEQQLADLAEALAMGVRSGLSVSQALEFEANEVEGPMSELISQLMAEQRLGTAFDVALAHLADALGTEDGRLFVLIVTIHARSGGNLAGALDEVTKTIRHRIAVRREVRALSAQGRMSAAILASLPIAFSLVLTAVSRDELIPIYRSVAGQAMVATGLAMETAAFMWMRRVLRVNV